MLAKYTESAQCEVWNRTTNVKAQEDAEGKTLSMNVFLNMENSILRSHNKINVYSCVYVSVCVCGLTGPPTLVCTGIRQLHSPGSP